MESDQNKDLPDVEETALIPVNSPGDEEEQTTAPGTESTVRQPEVQTLITNNPSETVQMEVHHHPHHPTHKKKWTEYLLDFFMIFFAVFLGFIAENVREHIVEGKKEKEYIQSMVEDLRKDSSYLQLCVDRYIPEHIRYFDSLILLLRNPEASAKSREIYQMFFSATTWNYNYVPTQRTLSQLRNNGFYLVKNNHVADVLSELDIGYTVYAAKNGFVHELQNDIDRESYFFADKSIAGSVREKQLANYTYTDMKASSGSITLADIPASASLHVFDKDALNSYIQKLEKYNYYLSAGLRAEYFRVLGTITMTKKILAKEYHLENE